MVLRVQAMRCSLRSATLREPGLLGARAYAATCYESVKERVLCRGVRLDGGKHYNVSSFTVKQMAMPLALSCKKWKKAALLLRVDRTNEQGALRSSNLRSAVESAYWARSSEHSATAHREPGIGLLCKYQTE